jgi:hypothetical protein
MRSEFSSSWYPTVELLEQSSIATTPMELRDPLDTWLRAAGARRALSRGEAASFFAASTLARSSIICVVFGADVWQLDEQGAWGLISS